MCDRAGEHWVDDFPPAEMSLRGARSIKQCCLTPFCLPSRLTARCQLILMFSTILSLVIPATTGQHVKTSSLRHPVTSRSVDATELSKR